MGGMFEKRHEGQSYIRSAGHLGWAFPAALGAKCGAPDRPVVCFMGDLGFWYHMAEVETAVRAGINTITIINNNNSGNMGKDSISNIYDGKPTKASQDIWVQNKINFAKIAEDMGAVGIRIEKANEIASAFQNALQLDKPVVIDIATDIEVVAPKAWEPKA